MRNWLKKKWVWAILGAVLIGAVAGVGFIPVTRTHTVAYPCSRTEEYTCTKTEDYTCTKFREVSYLDEETYTYTEMVEYTTTEEQPLAYATNMWAEESWWDCDIWVHVQIKNLDTEGGYFKATFKCKIGNTWYTKTQSNKYIGANQELYLQQEFGRSCGTPWDWSCEVTPDTKTVMVTKTRPEERVGVRNVWKTRQEPYEATCTREYETTCTREVQDTCYREEEEHDWLYWPKP